MSTTGKIKSFHEKKNSFHFCVLCLFTIRDKKIKWKFFCSLFFIRSPLSSFLSSLLTLNSPPSSPLSFLSNLSSLFFHLTPLLSPRSTLHFFLSNISSLFSSYSPLHSPLLALFSPHSFLFFPISSYIIALILMYMQNMIVSRDFRTDSFIEFLQL